VQFFYLREALCKSRNSKFAHKRVRVSPVELLILSPSHSPFYSPFSSAVIDPLVVLCGPQLASMLGCWAATKDVKAIGPCREHAQALFECMRTAVRFPRSYLRFVAGKLTNVIRVQQPMKRKQHRPSINYHLARLGKTLKD
jgi:hypothetical protein